MNYTVKSIFTLSVLVVTAAAAHAAPVGMAAHVTGKPEWKSDAAWKPLNTLQRLETGDAVRCGPGESAVIVLFGNGGRYTVGAGTTGTVSATGVAGGKSLGAPSGASAAVAQRLAGARTGSVMAREGASFERLHPQKAVDLAARLSPPVHDWLRADERSFTVKTMAGADSYQFTLFDVRDYVVFSQTVAPGANGPVVEIPANVKLTPRRPYTWRLHGFKNGRVLPASSWGITTVLTPEDEAQIAAGEKELLGADGKLVNDPVQLALLVELYRSYGVLQNAVEVLEADALREQPGLEATRGEIFAQAGGYAVMLADKARHSSGAIAGDN